MRKLILIAITFLASVFCVLPFYVPVSAASTSQVSNVIVNERKIISDLEFQVSMNSVSDQSVISVPQYYTYDRYKYKTVCQPESSQTEIVTCRLYKYDAGTMNSNTQQQEYEINASHTDDITLNLIESFGDNVSYSYTVKNIYQIIFNDDKTHSGYLQYSSDSSLSLLSDNENVAINSNKIYFFDKGAFNIYYTAHVTNSSILQLDSGEDITITSFHEAQNDADFSDILQALEDIDADINDIYSYLQKRFDWDIPQESFGINWTLFNYLSNTSIKDNNYWGKYPIFDGHANDVFLYIPVYQSNPTKLIIGVNKNISNTDQLNSLISSSNSNDVIAHVRNIDRYNPIFRFIELQISTSVSSHNSYFTLNENCKIIGIYLSSAFNMGMTQDFEDLWFNTASDDQAGQVDDIADDIEDIESDYHDIETDIISDMDGQLEEIDLQSDPFGTNQGSFVSSMSWVVQQFNYFASPNNVMGQLITFVLTIGLALVIIGKLR